jgi:hypothetical protein
VTGCMAKRPRVSSNSQGLTRMLATMGTLVNSIPRPPWRSKTYSVNRTYSS